ncbi:MAG: hypothetical protein CM15mP103_04760 [Gammaproteobacteria bacterium]|nr:MAG: hypothetical protein CM15mP103_04760 [Gammaproteobacteria bacterium]
MSRVLALDTATQACTLALYDEGSAAGAMKCGASLTTAIFWACCQRFWTAGAGRRRRCSLPAGGAGVVHGFARRGECGAGISLVSGATGQDSAPDRSGVCRGHHGFCRTVTVLSTIDAQIDQFYGLWGEWRGGAFVADGSICCAPEDLLLSRRVRRW